MRPSGINVPGSGLGGVLGGAGRMAWAGEGSAGVAGLGAVVPLQWENLALSFELSVHALRTPVERAFSSRLLGEDIEVTTSSVSPSSEPVTFTTHVQLLIGFSWFFR